MTFFTRATGSGAPPEAVAIVLCRKARRSQESGQRRAQLSLLLNVLTDAARSFENIVKPRGGEEVSR
jgi:hypothetical protein